MMNAMKENPDNYPYYKHLLEAGMTDQQIYNYAYGQKRHICSDSPIQIRQLKHYRNTGKQLLQGFNGQNAKTAFWYGTRL